MPSDNRISSYLSGPVITGLFRGAGEIMHLQPGDDHGNAANLCTGSFSAIERNGR